MKRKIFRKILGIYLILTLVLCGNITVKSEEDTKAAVQEEQLQEVTLADEDRPEAVAPELVEEKNILPGFTIRKPSLIPLFLPTRTERKRHIYLTKR